MENDHPAYPFKWQIGRLDDPHLTSLRFVPPLVSRGELRNVVIFYGATVLLSLLATVWLTLILLLLPFGVLLYAGVIQHVRFRDVVNKKFERPLSPFSHLIESVLIAKGLPYERQTLPREIRYTLTDGLELRLYPCREYIDPKNNAVRWMVDPAGKITDCAIRPATDEKFPLIESITAKIDEAMTAPTPETG